jgi:hypothetical protein
MNIEQFIVLAKRFNSTACDDMDKDQYHRAAKSVLKKVAKELGFTPGSFEIRSNKGGHAVAGEITLHHEKVYIQFNDCMGGKILYRSCNGLKDYTGGPNNWMTFDALTNMKYFSGQILPLIFSR